VSPSSVRRAVMPRRIRSNDPRGSARKPSGSSLRAIFPHVHFLRFSSLRAAPALHIFRFSGSRRLPGLGFRPSHDFTRPFASLARSFRNLSRFIRSCSDRLPVPRSPIAVAKSSVVLRMSKCGAALSARSNEERGTRSLKRSLGIATATSRAASRLLDQGAAGRPGCVRLSGATLAAHPDYTPCFL
jgi:hypothetical protein